jgi:aspartokinase-like uncharacterized kinase
MNGAVVKVGGSLALHPDKLKALCTTLNRESKKHKIVIIPGGGEFADVVRRLDEQFSLSCSTSHKMAVLAMDQFGLLLSDLMSNSAVVNAVEEVAGVLAAGRLPIFLPSRLLFYDISLENSWDVTSDSIAAYLSNRLHLRKILLVTDIDGIYTSDPKKHPDARFIEKLSASELLAINARTSVDKFLPKLMLKLHVDCFVVNGMFSQRVEAILEGQNTVCTLITTN